MQSSPRAPTEGPTRAFPHPGPVPPRLLSPKPADCRSAGVWRSETRPTPTSKNNSVPLLPQEPTRGSGNGPNFLGDFLFPSLFPFFSPRSLILSPFFFFLINFYSCILLSEFFPLFFFLSPLFFFLSLLFDFLIVFSQFSSPFPLFLDALLPFSYLFFAPSSLFFFHSFPSFFGIFSLLFFVLT